MPRWLLALALWLPASLTAESATTALSAPTELASHWAAWPEGTDWTRERAAGFGDLRWWRRDIGVDLTGSPRRLRVRFEPGKWGERNFLMNLGLPERRRYTLDYAVRFAPGFEFNQGNRSTFGPETYGGGKLPGLAAGTGPSGGHHTPGMSVRLMWRGDGHGADHIRNYLEAYVYWAGMADTYGDRLFLQEVQAGRDYAIRLHVDLGTEHEAGLVRIEIDGVERLRRPFAFKKPGDIWLINQVMWHVFYGGNDPSWAPLQPTTLDFSDFRAYSEP